MLGGGMMMDTLATIGTLCAAPAPSDRAFIDAMIPHLLSAILIAEVAMQLADHRDLKSLAQAIFAAQQREIEEMRSWRAA